jgi:integrase
VSLFSILERRLIKEGRYAGSKQSLDNDTIAKYISEISSMSKSTAYEYSKRLSYFEAFVLAEYRTSVDNIIRKINNGTYDPYNVLSSYRAFLQDKGSISAITMKQQVITIKNFLEYSDVDISPRKFKLKVKLPKAPRKNKRALSKEDIAEILNACSDIKLKTYVMFLASTGCRAVEALSIRAIDLDDKSSPARILIRGEYAKTKVERTIFLTDEMTKQLRQWVEFKHRTRRVCQKDRLTGKTLTEYRTLTPDPYALIFAVRQDIADPDPRNLYTNLRIDFAKTLDRIGKGSREDNKRRRKITLHSFRRFVKSTISDLGFGHYSEDFIGHDGSTYYRKTVREKAEIFTKIEPYLTFLDFATPERKGADTNTRIEELESINQILRQKDSMNTDAIATLSDQLDKVMQEIEILKKQK